MEKSTVDVNMSTTDHVVSLTSFKPNADTRNGTDPTPKEPKDIEMEDQDPKVDYSSKAKHKTQFSDYGVFET